MNTNTQTAPPLLGLMGNNSSICQLLLNIRQIDEINANTIEILNNLTKKMKDFILYKNTSKIIFKAYDNLAHLDTILSKIGYKYLETKDEKLLKAYKKLSKCIADEATCWLAIAIKVGNGATYIPAFFDKNCIKMLFDYGITFFDLDAKKFTANKEEIELILKQFGLKASLSDYEALVGSLSNNEIASLIHSVQIDHPELVAELGGINAINNYVSSIKTQNATASDSFILLHTPEMLEGNSSMVVSGETDALNYLLGLQNVGTLTADQQEELNNLTNKFVSTYGIQPTIINTQNIIGTVNSGTSGGQYGTSGNPSGGNVINTNSINLSSFNIPMPNNLDSLMGGVVTDALGITDSNSWNSLMGVFDGVVEDINSYINNAISTVTGMIGDFLDNLVSFVSAVIGQLFGVFRRPVGTNLIDGYSEYLFSEVSDAYYDVMGAILPENKFNANSELKVTENIETTEKLISMGGKIIDPTEDLNSENLNLSIDNALYTTLMNDLILSHSTNIVSAENGVILPSAIDSRISNYNTSKEYIDGLIQKLDNTILDFNGINNIINNSRTLI